MYLNFYQRMGILPLKKRVNRDKCSFATKQRMFGVFAIDEILRYRGTRFPGSRTLCHPGLKLDRIDYIEIKILTRKGKLVEFVDECDVKIQLEFKRIN